MLDAVRRGLRGDFRGRRGIAALALTVLSWGLLAAIQRRNLTTPRPVLRKASGGRARGGLRRRCCDTLPSAPSPSGRPTAWRTTWSRRRYVEKTNIVRYGPHGRANLADMWRRRDLPRDGKAPVLLQVPGGAWAIGLRRPQAYPLMSHLADRGWICVSMDYRVSPRHTWPDHIIDVKRALAWVKENIADYGGDPDFVAISGGSAGGHLTALAALTPNDPQYQPGFDDADTSVVAAVPVYGRYDWFSHRRHGPPGVHRLSAEIRRQEAVRRVTARCIVDASPITRLRPDAPPFFVLHGTDDSIIPVDEGREFVDGTARGVDIAGAVRRDCRTPSTRSTSSPRRAAHNTADAVEQFLSWVHATRRPNGD